MKINTLAISTSTSANIIYGYNAERVAEGGAV